MEQKYQVIIIDDVNHAVTKYLREQGYIDEKENVVFDFRYQNAFYNENHNWVAFQVFGG